MDSYAVGKKEQSGVSAEYDEGAGWGTDVYQEDAERLRERSGECVAEDDFDALCTLNTETNSKVIVRKESADLDAQGLEEKRKRKRIVSLNPTVTWDNGTTSEVKRLSDHNVMRRVKRKSDATAAPPEDTSAQCEDEVRNKESARLTRERRVLNESCTAKMLTHLRDSIHSDPESGLLYWVSRVYDDKNLRMTMCDRVLILPNEEILASSAKSVPAGEVNLYPRLDLQLRPTSVSHLNEVSYGEEYEDGLE